MTILKTCRLKNGTGSQKSFKAGNNELFFELFQKPILLT